MELGLRERVVLVAGASSGIGRATAVAFAAEGAHVAVGYHRNRAGVERTAALAREAGGRAVPWQVDLDDPDSLEDAVERARGELGPVAVLVNNAVSWPSWPEPGEQFETAPSQRFTASVTANLVGPYLLARSVVGDMRARGWGRIAHVSTGLVEDGLPGTASYIAAKSGLHGLARAMSRELAAAGILTNVVMPGFTPGDREVSSAVMEQASAAAAIRRVTTPDEAARVIVLLCSAVNTSVTGEAVRADGHFLTPA
jgi:3-oxoacyl-[acyl-carrier protein] reductase